jgi:sugar phosphate isomerase/epimerase
MPFETCFDRCREATAEHVLLLSDPNAEPFKAGSSATQFASLLSSDPAAVRHVGIGIGGVMPLVQPRVSDDTALADSVNRLLPWVDAAIVVDARTLTLQSALPSIAGATHVQKQRDLLRLAALMDALAERAGDSSLTITTDIHCDSLVATVEDAQFLAAAFRQPRAGLLINSGHLTTGREEGWKLIEKNSDRVFAVGWKDHSLAKNRPSNIHSVELGTADTPFEKYIRAVKGTDASRMVHFVNVLHPPEGAEVPVLQRSFAYLRALWETVA